MPFDGRDFPTPPRKPITPMPTAAAVSDALMARPQARGYRVLAPDVFANIARMKFRGKPAELRIMGRLLKANVLLGGWIEATPGPDAPKPYRLNLTLYDGEGQLLGQLGYDVDSPSIEAGRFVTQTTAFLQMLDSALGLNRPPAVARPTPTPPTVTPSIEVPAPVQRPSAPVAVAQADDREAAPLSGPDSMPVGPHHNKALDVVERRPPWQEAFDLRVGYLYSSRALSNADSAVAFPQSGAHGVVLHGELYPASFFRAAGAASSGLGLRVTAQLPQWGSIKQQSQVGGAQTGSYTATERRIEVGLRWHWNPWDDTWRPDFEIEGLFGNHLFSLTNPVNLLYVSLPSADYRYLGAKFGLRLFPTRWLSFRGTLSFAKHLSMGQVTTPGQDASGASLRDQNGFQSYGPGSGWLWRADLGATAEIWRGIHAGFAFFYEQNQLTFQGQGNILRNDTKPVTSASDDYLGVMLTLGYTFRAVKSIGPRPVMGETTDTGNPGVAAPATTAAPAQPAPGAPAQ